MQIAKAQPGTTRIGFIGTGVMGRWMCQHVMTAGLRRDGLQRARRTRPSRCSTPARHGPIHARGGRREVRRRLRHRRLPERRARGVPRRRRGARRRKPGSVLVDMTTSEPSLARRDRRGGEGEGRCTRSTRRSPAATSGAKNAAPVDHGRRRRRRRRRGRARSSSAWARRSCTKGPPGRASTRRWSTRS